MEAITPICYLLTYSVGYFIGVDLYNFYKAREEFRELRDDLQDMKSVLKQINFNIKSGVNDISKKLPQCLPQEPQPGLTL